VNISYKKNSSQTHVHRSLNTKLNGSEKGKTNIKQYFIFLLDSSLCRTEKQTGRPRCTRNKNDRY
jgi:hypothetical protein